MDIEKRTEQDLRAAEYDDQCKDHNRASTPNWSKQKREPVSLKTDHLKLLREA